MAPNRTIDALGKFPQKVAVEALLEAFDFDFENKFDRAGAHNPQMFRDNIAKLLTQITGQNFGEDQEAWSNWWVKIGKRLPTEK